MHVLLLEDNPLDAELILARLSEGGIDCELRRVETGPDFRAALEQESLDLILADYTLPSFDGFAALQIAQEACPEMPFIFVSGSLGEELAIEALKRGATDYVLKQRLERLVPSVRRSLAEVQERNERRRLQEELQQRADALAAADRRKDEFLAMLAHELRNPLAPIRYAVELMRLSGADAAAVTRARHVIERQTQHMSRLVDDLLDVSRITRSKILLQRRPIDLSRLIREAAEDHRPALADAGLSLALELPPEPVWVVGDPTRLAQILDNLLQNAAKFSDPGGQVTVRLMIDDCRLMIEQVALSPNQQSAISNQQFAIVTVRDTGIGIPRDLLPHVFETFAQADRSLERRRGGLGLGLALVKGLVELHEGEVRAESEGAGHGTTIRFTLPVASGSGVGPELPTTLPSPNGRKRVLVVEDHQDTADTMRDLLEEWGHEVAVTYSGPEAVATARQWQPEVVLCDLGLPGMEGYAVAGELRRDPVTAATHLVAVTGYGQEEDRRRSQDAGFNAHLTKPVDPRELQQLLAGA